MTTTGEPLDVGPWFKELSNWGRWGDDDQAGTLNLITPDRVKAAGRLIQRGITVSCSRPLHVRTKEYHHFMTKSGEAAPAEGLAIASDWFGMGCHGFDYTHLDAHSHVIWDGQMYNGRPAALCTTEKGALAGGVEPAFGGISGRGVLVDGPRIAGVDWLPPRHGLGVEDLDAWFERHEIEIVPGDLLFLRTGRDRWEAEGVRTDGVEGFPGLEPECLPWLREKDISVLVSDVISDVMPTRTGAARLPIHAVGIVAMGLWILDNAELGALAETCAEIGRYAFYVTIAPLQVTHATGCPVNPIAVF